MLKGTVTTTFGDDINTDDIIPAFRLQQSNDPEYFGTYAFEKFDPEFRSRCAQRPSNVVLAGKNFGCGSSREQAVYALQYNCVACVIAASFPDIFSRNCLANGLTLIALTDWSGIGMGDEVEVDLAAGVVRNATRGTTISFSMKEEDRRTFQAGGMTARVKTHLEEILAGQPGGWAARGSAADRHDERAGVGEWLRSSGTNRGRIVASGGGRSRYGNGPMIWPAAFTVQQRPSRPRNSTD